MGLFYKGSKKFHIGNSTFHILFVAGQRSRGKTSVWLKELKKWYEKDHDNNKFIYLRRKEKQLELALSTGILNGSINAYPNEWEGVTGEKSVNNKFFIKRKDEVEHIGYTLSLNNVKGISIEDANVLLFDEYIEPTRSAYKGGDGGINEPELFARLLETLFRNREYWVICLGNFDSPTNPYNEYFHIPFNSHGWSDKVRGIMYEEDVSEDTATAKSNSVTGRIFSSTPYLAYSNGERAMGEVRQDFIVKDVPSHCKLMYNVQAFNKKLTIWYDDISNVMYVCGKRSFNMTYPVLSVTTQDMSIDTFFIKYSLEIIQILKSMYGRGRVRFTSQEVSSIFLNILQIK